MAVVEPAHPEETKERLLDPGRDRITRNTGALCDPLPGSNSFAPPDPGWSSLSRPDPGLTSVIPPGWKSVGNAG